MWWLNFIKLHLAMLGTVWVTRRKQKIEYIPWQKAASVITRVFRVHRRLMAAEDRSEREPSGWPSSGCWTAARCVCATGRGACPSPSPRPRWGTHSEIESGWAGGPGAAGGSGSAGSDRTRTSPPSARLRGRGLRIWGIARPVCAALWSRLGKQWAGREQRFCPDSKRKRHRHHLFYHKPRPPHFLLRQLRSQNRRMEWLE